MRKRYRVIRAFGSHRVGSIIDPIGLVRSDLLKKKWIEPLDPGELAMTHAESEAKRKARHELLIRLGKPVDEFVPKPAPKPELTKEEKEAARIALEIKLGKRPAPAPVAEPEPVRDIETATEPEEELAATQSPAPRRGRPPKDASE